MLLTTSHAVGPSEPEIRDLTLGDLLGWAADTAPERVALIAGVTDLSARRSWTYAELHASFAAHSADALLRRFEPGERVAVWAPNIPEWIMMEFGATLAGLVLVTVNPAFKRHKVEYVLDQSKAVGIVLARAFRGNPMLATIEEIRPRCPDLREVICFDQWDEFLDSATGPPLSSRLSGPMMPS